MAVHNDQLNPSRALARAFASAPGRERERAQGGHPTSTARRPARSKRPAGYARSCPARCAGPCTARLSGARRAAVWLAVRNGTKRWNAKAREGRNRRGYPLASRAHPFQPGTGARGAESARMPGMVGRERRGGRNAASGAGRTEHPFNRTRHSAATMLLFL